MTIIYMNQTIELILTVKGQPFTDNLLANGQIIHSHGKNPYLKISIN